MLHTSLVTSLSSFFTFIVYSSLQALLNEISSYEANIHAVEKESQELVSSEHFASDTIEEQNRELQHRWNELKLLASRRTQKLNDALEAQKVHANDGTKN